MIFVPAHFLAEVSSAVTRRTDNEVEGIALGVPLVTWDQQLLDRATLLVDVQQPAA